VEDKNMAEPVSVSAGIAAAAGKKVIGSVLSDLYDVVKKQTGEKIAKWNTVRKVSELYTKIDSVRKVKTLWQLDKAVDINEFYCDSHVKIPKSRKRDEFTRKKIKSVSNFGRRRNLLIQGIAGQGKSMFMRYLCTTEFLKGERIPVFIELRRIQQNTSLLYHISLFLEILDLSISDSVFRTLTATGKFIFFLA
jgi:hypothetical protein